MSNEPKVSIVIPFYNCQYIDQAIQSALQQTYPHIEVIVVDDGSTKYSEKITPYLGNITFIKKANGGTASALNAGIRHATGHYFAWLSADDLYDPHKIARQLAFMRAQNIQVSYTSYYLIDGNSKITTGPIGVHYPTRRKFLEKMKQGCFINGCTVMLHMEVFQKVGLFDETIRFAQDYDLWLRVLRHYHFHYLDEPLCMYRVHDEMGSNVHQKEIPAEIVQVQNRHQQVLHAIIQKEVKPLRFTFPILTLCFGGAQRMLVEIVNGLAERGHDVTILMPKQGVIEYPIKAKVVRCKQDYVIEESDYPAGEVIVSNYYTIVPGAQAASVNGKGLHVRLSLCYEPVFLPENHVTFRTYHLTRHVLTLSKWQHELIRLIHGIESDMIPVGVSRAFHNLNVRQSMPQLQISAILRKPEGGFSWHREQEYLLNSLATVKNRYPHVRINLFTPPNEFASSPALQKLKAENKHSFRFLTPGDDTEMCYHYSETHIFVNSSTYDTASMPGLEAMKCGAALVTTYGGGNLDYCRHEENCLLSYRYQNRLADDIIRLIENPALRRRLALAGEQEAARWTWERSVELFEQAVRKRLSDPNA